MQTAGQLLALYRQIDGLMPLSWRSPQVRRWQAEALDALRRALGFHPVVVQFQGLRFRAGPVTGGDDAADVPEQRHDERMRADLAEARRLLRSALQALGVDPDAATAAALPTGAGAAAASGPASGAGRADGMRAAPAAQGLLVAAAAADPTLTAAQRGAVAAAGERLDAALARDPAAWEPVAEALRELLGFGGRVGAAAVRAVAARLPPT